eukprot:SAG22_NODE_27_length_29018_cov_465.809646_37_plen_77_part_00
MAECAADIWFHPWSCHRPRVAKNNMLCILLCSFSISSINVSISDVTLFDSLLFNGIDHAFLEWISTTLSWTRVSGR